MNEDTHFDPSLKKAKVRRRLRVSLLVLLIASALAFFGLRLGVDIEPVAFTTKDNVKIRGYLISPEGRASERLPAAVFCHGLGASKEVYVYGLRRLARSGMRVLAIDFRGHGRSSGFSDFGKSESIDALAGVSYLLNRHDVDPDRIAVVGHSLGGIIGTMAGCQDAGKSVRAVAAIYCWHGFQDAVEDIFGPLDRGFIGNLWHSFAWQHSFPLTEQELRARDVTPLLSPDRRPPNYLLIHAAREVLISRTKAEELLARAAGGIKNVRPGVTFGNPKNNSARKFVLVKGNHGSEAINPQTYRAIETWLSMCLNAPIAYGGFDTGLVPVIIGTIAALAAVLYIYTLIRTWFALSIPKTKKNDAERTTSRQAVIAGIGLIALSAPAFWLAQKAGMPLIVRTWFGDVMATFALTRIILCLPVLAVLVIVHGNKTKMFLQSLAPGMPSGNDWGLGLAPTIWLIVSLSLLGLVLWIPPALPKHWPSFVFLFVILFIHHLIEEVFFRGFILSSLGPGSTRKAAAITGLVGGLGLGAAFIACFPSLTYTIHLPQFSIPMLPVVIVLFPAVYYLHGSLATYLYSRTANILVPAASMALFLAWLLTSIGVRAA